MSTVSSRAVGIFSAAIELEAEKRAAYLDQTCSSDSALRQHVESLLRAHAEAATYIEPGVGKQPAATPGAGAGLPPEPISTLSAEKPGDQIGHYTLQEKIGEGGMGEVWVAKQTEPVKRKVALKLIKKGMDSRAVLQRFEQERQALALMDHPNIARVLDGGMAPTGQPYFVMELVNGLPLVKFCDEAKLSTTERLQLFVPVCQAVQHAHQKGIIHRDLKPANILVTLIDGKPVPKIIDFGVAKATSGRLTDSSLSTQFGAVVGTFEYMAPEQAGFSGDDVDTRADIYSLGVILYELLTGLRPIEGKRLKQAALSEIIRIIREEEPTKPSTRFSTDQSSPSLAAVRQTEPRKLATLLRGELDWVVMKCLEKDRTRRYETANGLARDIQRYLANEMVEARPASRGYRLQKLVRRNQGAVMAGAAIAMALLLGVAAFGWQAKLARRQRDLAVQARQAADEQRSRAVKAERDARQKADDLDKVADFQGKMLAQVDPMTAGLRLSEDVRARYDAALGKAEIPDADRPAMVETFVNQWSRVNATDTTREFIDRTILKPAVAAIDKQFADQPVLAATLRNVLAERYHDLGFDEEALALGQQVLSERRRILGPDDPETIVALGNVGAYLTALGRYDDAEPLYREALEKSRRVNGNDAQATLLCMANLASLLHEKGKYNEAEPLYRDALQLRRRVLGEDHPDTLVSLNDWARILDDEGKLAESETFYREVLAKRRRILGEDHVDTLRSVNDLAALLKKQAKLDEAVSYFREAVEKRRILQGDMHPRTILAIQNLGATLDAAGHADEAEKLLREALANERRVLGVDHADSLAALGNFCVFLIGQNKLAEAEPLCRETLERRRRVLGESHPTTLIADNVMGLVLTKQGKYADAEPYWRDTMEVSRRTLGPAHPDTLIYTHNLARLMMDEQKPAEAEKLFREVVQNGSPTIGAGHPTVLSATRQLGDILLDQKRDTEALDLLSASELPARKTYKGNSERSLAAYLALLGRAHNRAGQYPAAETNLLESSAIYVRTRGPVHADTLGSTKLLVAFYTAWDKAEPGKGHDTKAAEWTKKLEAITTQSTNAPAAK